MPILIAENISKQYRLGNVGTGTLAHDLNRFWYKLWGKQDPYLKVGAINDRNTKSDSPYVWALRDINFEVQAGEVLGIIGRNGAGKSTLLKILSRVTSPTTGSIKTKGRIASLLEVGTGFHPELTGRENIFLNGAILGMSREEITKKLDEIIEFSGCSLYIDTPVKRYSSGMKVRLAFAVAAHLEPDILVVDEVLAVGDAEFQKKAVGKMQDITKGTGRTVLFVSHNMESVEQLCTRGLVMDNGHSVFQGGVEEAIGLYLGLNKENKQLHFPIDGKGIAIENFKVLDHLSNEVSAVLLGKACTFRFQFSNNSEESILINIRAQIFNGQGSLITTFNTYHVNQTQQISPDNNFIVNLEIDKMPINQGDYVIGIQLMDLRERKVLYENENFYDLQVYNGDYFESGKLPNKSNAGIFLMDYKWTFEKNNKK